MSAGLVWLVFICTPEQLISRFPGIAFIHNVFDIHLSSMRLYRIAAELKIVRPDQQMLRGCYDAANMLPYPIQDPVVILGEQP